MTGRQIQAWRWLVGGSLALGAWSLPTFVAPAPAHAAIDDLKKTLEQVLKARRPEDFAFVARVVELVDAGTLPRDMVESTMNWARKKPRRQFQYFEFALRARAKQIGVEL